MKKVNTIPGPIINIKNTYGTLSISENPIQAKKSRFLHSDSKSSKTQTTNEHIWSLSILCRTPHIAVKYINAWMYYFISLDYETQNVKNAFFLHGNTLLYYTLQRIAPFSSKFTDFLTIIFVWTLLSSLLQTPKQEHLFFPPQFAS